MNNLLSETKYLCKKYNLWPQRQSGQNFLINQQVFTEILKTAELSKNDFVLEIGAGFGTLTQRLAGGVKKVWAVELEKNFLLPLNKLKKNYPNIKVIREDILKLDIKKLIGGHPYKIVANLPYNITSQVLRIFLTCDPKPVLMVLLLQKEVAERITAQPGNLSLLAVSVQFYAKPRIIGFIDKINFWPEPMVDSAITKIEKIKTGTEINKTISEKKFFQVVRAGFAAKRKQIHNNLANSLHCENEKIKKVLYQNGIDAKTRAQDISLDQWKALTDRLIKEGII